MTDWGERNEKRICHKHFYELMLAEFDVLSGVSSQEEDSEEEGRGGANNRKRRRDVP